jgi:hypothetical protein
MEGYTQSTHRLSEKRSTPWLRGIGIILLFSVATAACERDTTLRIDGNNPPNFKMSGSGRLGFLRIHGPKVREGEGETAFIVWEIQPKAGFLAGERVETLRSITYGKVPSGYAQVYPETGEAPPLLEGVKYEAWAETTGANGARKYFTIRNGKAIELPDE